MVRNLWMRNVLPWRPTRSWRNITGPRESSLIAMATASSSGDSSSSPSAEAITSNARLAMSLDGGEVAVAGPGDCAHVDAAVEADEPPAMGV
jgi:hypothetical protein